MSGMNLGDMGLPLSEPINGDEYVRTVLVSRQQAWFDAHPEARDRGFPPLLEWFVQAADEQFVRLPDPDPKPSKPQRPRQYRSAASLRAERDEVEGRMMAVAGADDVGGGDRAIANLSPYARSRAARNAGRRRFAQLDRDLGRYTRLKTRYDALTGRIAAADARENKLAQGVEGGGGEPTQP
ncbi:MAG TPA: hypothetical protein VHH34_04855 [Pseudonocardiaceae bacterium]|nr:hypothetical protein [Pseudonocardiaceae bacterium]